MFLSSPRESSSSYGISKACFFVMVNIHNVHKTVTQKSQVHNDDFLTSKLRTEIMMLPHYTFVQHI